MKKVQEKNIKCKFCGKEKKLIGAHIVPRCFYLALKENDRYLCINSKTGKYKIQQKGSLDKNILCEDCDSKILGKFDKEAHRVLLENFSNYKYFKLLPFFKIYRLKNTEFDYYKLRNFFISLLWRASISDLDEWSNINLGGYEKKALEILKGEKEYDELFKILIYKNCNNEGFNKEVIILKGKTSKYKKYVIQMAGYCIEVMVDSSRISKQYKLQYNKYFLNPNYAHIIETPEVSWRINKEFNSRLSKLKETNFKPPVPAGAALML